MLPEYRTIYQGGEDEIVEKKSRFIATVIPVENEEEALEFIEKTKKKLQELKNEDLEIKQEKMKQTIDYFNQIIEAEVPDKAVLNMLIDKIYIYHDKSVKFELKIDINKII